MSVVFDNPPILETVCDFQFEPGQSWDWTVPGLFYERVRTTFPLKEEQRTFQMTLPSVPGSEAVPPQVTVSRLQFLREDKRALVQIGPNFLAMNHLRPYPTWEPYRDMVFGNLATYIEVAKPSGIRSMGLRYINKIEFPEPADRTPFAVDVYMQAIPGIPQALLKEPVKSFVQRVEIPAPSGHGVLALQTGNAQPDMPNNLAFLLDLAYTASFEKPMRLEDAPEWAEQAHTEIEDAFFACITPQAHILFKKRKNE